MMAVDRQCPVERRHLEMMAATLPIEALEPLAWEDCKESVSEIEAELARRRVRMARAIQAEVAEQGATNAELEAVCPVPPFPGIRGGGAGE